MSEKQLAHDLQNILHHGNPKGTFADAQAAGMSTAENAIERAGGGEAGATRVRRWLVGKYGIPTSAERPQNLHRGDGSVHSEFQMRIVEQMEKHPNTTKLTLARAGAS